MRISLETGEGIYERCYDVDFSEAKTREFLKTKFNLREFPIFVYSADEQKILGSRIGAKQLAHGNSITFFMHSIATTYYTRRRDLRYTFMKTFAHELSHFILLRSRGITATIHNLTTSVPVIIALACLPAFVMAVSIAFSFPPILLFLHPFLMCGLALIFFFISFPLSAFFVAFYIDLFVREPIAEKLERSLIKNFYAELSECIIIKDVADGETIKTAE